MDETWFDPELAKARGLDTRSIALAKHGQRARAESHSLVSELEAAFVGVPRPRITLAVAHGLDDEWELSPEKEAELRAYDPEEDWRDVKSPEWGFFIYFNYGDAESCRFYFPVFLRESLKSFPFSQEREVFLDLLSKPEKTALFDERQMNCLRRFAELCELYPESHDSDEF